MYKNIPIQAIGKQMFAGREINTDMLRLDLVHPEISGNKWFKLKYYLENVRASGKKAVVSFGGAYSNHLVALAYACRENGLRCTGIIRGEKPAVYSPSLQQMCASGMELIFTSRSDYKNKEELISKFADEYYVIPEGGSGYEGIRGAAEILNTADASNYSHIVCATGTGTTLAGLINGSHSEQQLIGICSLKVADSEHNELLDYIGSNVAGRNYSVLFNYHFGGYAKKNEALINFMNTFYQEERIALDFVYTGKMVFAVYDLIDKNYFPAGSSLLLIHTGGLQGNRGLGKEVLNY